MDPLDKIQQRALQYWHIDGLTEIAFGGILLVLGGFFFAQALLPQDSLLSQLLNMGLVLLLVASGLIGGRFVSLAKGRLTYPRTGYVTYPKAGGRRRWIGAVLAMLIGSLTAGLIAAAPASLAWMPAISGLTLGAVLLVLGYRFGLLRFYLLSLLVLVFGVGLALGGIGDSLGIAVFYTLAGLALLLSGSLILWLYLRRNPPAPESQP
jgi:hypothetical protein